jgi:branched-chain amino acid transport system substrate-binding protein
MVRALLLMVCVGVGLSSGSARAQTRTIKVAGFGAKSGVVRSFGANSEAVLQAVVAEINEKGGIKLADGASAKLEVTFLDDRCVPEEGISVLRRLASEQWILGIGPSCSNVAEPLFGILQKRVGDANDTGLQFPIFTDTAIKGGLARLSDWAFRNVPNEGVMYGSLFQWLHEQHPDMKTMWGGVEEDFAHSRAGWYSVMKDQATKAGFEVKGEVKWLLNDSTFTTQVREWRREHPDVIAIAAHPFTTCGVLREMARQKVKPKVVVGLTSSSTLETLSGCAKEAEGIIIPTSFAPVTDAARYVAKQTEKYKGNADLHSAAVWENLMALKELVRKSGVEARPETVQKDRLRVRDALAQMTEMEGLLGTITRTPDRESNKPYLFVTARSGKWEVIYDPRKGAN